jgi:hypothetical protein
MKEDIEKSINETRNAADGEKPMLIGPSGSGRSAKALTKLVNNLKDVITSDKRRYFPEEVPDNLFTRNELKMMGLVPTGDFDAWVWYPEQKRAYQLYGLSETRSPKRQGGFSLVRKDHSLQDVLNKRKHAIKVRINQLHTEESDKRRGL